MTADTGIFLDEPKAVPIQWELSICKKKYVVEAKSVLDAFHQIITGPNKPDAMGLIYSAREFPDGKEYWFNTEGSLRELGVWSDTPPEGCKPRFFSNLFAKLLNRFW